MRIPLLLCPFFVVAVALPSQTTHLVGAGGFAEIRQALAMAQPGDRILVGPGTYAHFTATVGVTIRALVPGSVEVRYDSSYAPPGCTFLCNLSEGPTRFEVPAGQTAHVVGLLFQPTVHASTFTAYHRVEVGSGRVHFEDCALRSNGFWALRVDQSAHVHLNACTVAGIGNLWSGAHGVLVVGGKLTAVGSTMAGGAQLQNQIGVGLQANSATVHLSDCVLMGGALQPFGITYPALRGSGSAFLHGCVVQGGGCAVEWGLPQPEFDDCTFSSPTNCGIPTGPFPSLVGAEQVDPLLLGAVATQRWFTYPNGLLLLVGSYGLGATPMPGVLAEPSWLDQSSWFFLGVFAADASGQLTTSFVVPNVPQLRDEQVWLSAASWPVFPLRTSPPVGGVIR